MKKKLKDKVLAEGEATGHAHRVGVDVYEDDDFPGLKFFSGETTITHEQHKPVALPKKAWVSGGVQEYDHAKEESRRVQD